MQLVQRPNGVWYTYTRQDGKAKFRSTGERQYDAALAAVSPSPTISHLKERYIQFLLHSRKARKTRMMAQRAFDLLIDFSSDRRLDQLTKSELIAFTDWARTRLAEQSVYAYWRSLKRALALAPEWFPELRGVDLKPRYARKAKPLPAVMDGGEVAILLATVTIPWLHRMIRLCLFTGMRRGEVCNLRWSDIDIGRKLIYLHRKADWSAKSGVDAEVIPLADDAVGILRSIPREGEYIFTNRHGGKLYEPHVSRIFKRHVERAGLNPRIHFHSLRHTFATLLLRSGVGVYEVSKLMRHRSVVTTEIYLHVLSNELHSSVNRLKIA